MSLYIHYTEVYNPDVFLILEEIGTIVHFIKIQSHTPVGIDGLKLLF